MENTVKDFGSARRFVEKGRSWCAGRPVASNTRILPVRVHIDDEWIDGFGVLVHSTVVVTYLPDGRQILNSGGWSSKLTKARIHEYSLTRIVSEPARDANGKILPGNKWHIGTSTEYTTPARVTKCRTCRGDGGREVTNVAHGRYTENGWQLYETPKKTTYYQGCYRCGDSGKADYGSQDVHSIFKDGSVIDKEGTFVGMVDCSEIVYDYTPRPYSPREYYGTAVSWAHPSAEVRSVWADRRTEIDDLEYDRADDLAELERTYTQSPSESSMDGDTAAGISFSVMTAEAEAELAAWDAMLKSHRR